MKLQLRPLQPLRQMLPLQPQILMPGHLQISDPKLETQLAKTSNKVSNLDKYIETAIDFSPKLNTVWHSSNYMNKQKLQFLVFPDGIYYNRKNDECRTVKVNTFFQYMSSLKRVSEEKEKREPQSNLHVPSLVARTGIEPMTFGL